MSLLRNGADGPGENACYRCLCVVGLYCDLLQGDGFIVRVRGLPWSATRDDIVNFFSPVAVTGGPQGVHFTFTRDGRPSGEAFIEFSSPEDLEAALSKHNAHMGRRYVEVFRSKKSEREWVLQKNGQGGGKVEAVVRLRGLPYGCGKEDIEQFFSGETQRYVRGDGRWDDGWFILYEKGYRLLRMGSL